VNIALLGSAPSSIMGAPFKDASFAKFTEGMPAPKYPPAKFIDESWEIWACSPGAFGRVERCTRFFEVHRWEPGAQWFSPEYCQWLREFEGIVYTGAVIPEIKNHQVYPIKRVEDEFSSYFLTSSLSLMLAVAILEIEDARKAGKGDPAGNDTIGMWGVDMAATEEWNEQRPGCQFFLLEALRRGIRIFVPEESDLLRPMPVYGLSEWDHRYIKTTARMRELNSRRITAEQTAAQCTQEATFLKGATEDLIYNIKTWGSEYGLPSGVFVKQDAGSGMGGMMKLHGDPSVPSPADVKLALELAKKYDIPTGAPMPKKRGRKPKGNSDHLNA